MRAKNVLCATVGLLLVDKVLMAEAKANKVKSKDKMIKEEEEEVAPRRRRKSRCLEVNWQSCSRSWKGLLRIVLSAKKNLLSWIVLFTKNKNGNDSLLFSQDGGRDDHCE